MTHIRDWAIAELEYLTAHPTTPGHAQRHNDAVRALAATPATSTGDRAVDGPASAWDDLWMAVADLLNARAHQAASVYATNLSFFDGDVAGHRAHELIEHRRPALMDAVKAAAFAPAGKESHVAIEQVWAATDSSFVSQVATEIAMVELARWYSTWREAA
ncbi:hypothetical protein SAMN04489765_3826 [Tsukamurella pulmonis]|uniref:Uncharacterized protein n=1 Tax=Tsukamurella pulmonis TaxID=47312 RepID=A0A1H1H5D8_9ACTN|nr:hypothetical protein [Tsukamurella pulmonis]SDR20589.1 hypothetical protein SAMN04489765_3826 [Tsukamurella pulmonis]SUP15918.1 Uncharacterised protein [Tsukamurella pulmonis]